MDENVKKKMKYRSLLNNLVSRGFYTKFMSKKTRNKARKNLRSLKSKAKIYKTIETLIKLEKQKQNAEFKAKKFRKNSLNFGEIIEIDACEHE
ncbi:UNVERIFIED_CONTAM: hypothetical protein O8I53_07415 [Campylobacter lari]